MGRGAVAVLNDTAVDRSWYYLYYKVQPIVTSCFSTVSCRTTVGGGSILAHVVVCTTGRRSKKRAKAISYFYIYLLCIRPFLIQKTKTNTKTFSFSSEKVSLATPLYGNSRDENENVLHFNRRIQFAQFLCASDAAFCVCKYLSSFIISSSHGFLIQ